MYACICFGINEKRIRECVREGATTLEALADACGAGSDCHECQERLQRIIEDETKAEASAVD